jgi:hypothetical protein
MTGIRVSEAPDDDEDGYVCPHAAGTAGGNVALGRDEKPGVDGDLHDCEKTDEKSSEGTDSEDPKEAHVDAVGLPVLW